MQGRIYRVKLVGEYDELHHPFVVVLEFSGSRDCLVVPAFDAEGYKVNDSVAAFVASGYPPDTIFVELDNARFVSFRSAHTGKTAKWMVARYTRLSISVLNACECIGTMNAEGLSDIANGLLRLAGSRPQRFSPSALKKLKQIA